MNLATTKYSDKIGNNISLGNAPEIIGGRVEVGAKPSFAYRIIRWLCRQISATWFREHGIVDEEWIPEEGGVLYAAWHPGSLIDPLLMLSLLPGQLTFVAKHTLFKTPLLGRFMRAAGAKPVYRRVDSESLEGGSKNANKGNSALIDTLSEVLSEGGRCAIYPEGISHLMSKPQKTKTGPARIMLQAIREADKTGSKRPALVPVGLHYSDANRFRERALVTVHPPMNLPALPGEEGAPAPSKELLAEFDAETAADRAWVQAVTNALSTELQRTSQGLDSWEDKKLLWRARGLLSVHRNRATGRKSRASYAEAVVGARRARAAWLWISDNDPGRAAKLKVGVSKHSEKMDKYNLKEYELYDRDKTPGPLDLIKAVGQIIWSWMWMAGLITWGAMIGSWPPYRISGPIAQRISIDEKHALGTYKIALGFMLLPLWWFIISFPVAFLLAAPSSPLWNLNLYGLLPLIKPYLMQINWVLLAFVLMPLWSVAARLHLQLWRRSMRALATLKRWLRLRQGEVPWDELADEQLALAKELDEIGQALILPGDKEWTAPATGIDDYQCVVLR